MTSPTWLERPARALAHVRANLRGDIDARAQQARVAREAESAADRARELIWAWNYQAPFDAGRIRLLNEPAYRDVICSII